MRNVKTKVKGLSVDRIVINQNRNILSEQDMLFLLMLHQQLHTDPSHSTWIRIKILLQTSAVGWRLRPSEHQGMGLEGTYLGVWCLQAGQRPGLGRIKLQGSPGPEGAREGAVLGRGRR